LSVTNEQSLDVSAWVFSTGFCHVSRHICAAGSAGSGFLRLPLDKMMGLIAMDCGGCSSAVVTERPNLTAQGYRRFRCRDCGKQFNERSDGVLNRAALPSDVIAFVVFCRLRYRLTLRDLSEIMLLREFTVSHECIRQWEAKLLPVMGEALRKRRQRQGLSGISCVGSNWMKGLYHAATQTACYPGCPS
jgi:transposase-like protein